MSDTDIDKLKLAAGSRPLGEKTDLLITHVLVENMKSVHCERQIIRSNDAFRLFYSTMCQVFVLTLRQSNTSVSHRFMNFHFRYISQQVIDLGGLMVPKPDTTFPFYYASVFSSSSIPA